jgi:Uncharacterised nucleotidyltransferase
MEKVSDVNLKPVLMQPLSVLLPTEEQTWLLRACLWSGEQGARAWARWSARIVDPAGFLRQDRDGIKGLLPLLFDSLQKKKVAVEQEFHTYLRTAYLRDELRSKAYSRIGRDVTSIFSSAGIPAVLLKGAALAETVYEKPGLQHAHYLEILVKNSDAGSAVGLLPSLGFSRLGSPLGAKGQAVELVHESGLPLIIHRRLFRVPFYDISSADIWARSRIQTVSGSSIRLLSPADNLTHICGSVFDAGSHESLRWVCDAWFLIHRYPNLGWEILLNHASTGRMALSLFVTLDYLAERLNAPIPAGVLNRLCVAASKSGSIECEIALFGVQKNARGGLMKILRCDGGWSTRAWVMKWALLPSPTYVRWVHEVPWAWLLPFYYLYRPLKYLSRSAWISSKRLLWRLWESVAATRSEPKTFSS